MLKELQEERVEIDWSQEELIDWLGEEIERVIGDTSQPTWVSPLLNALQYLVKRIPADKEEE